VDLHLSPDQYEFAREAREWLAANLRLPGPFADLAAEIEWGRRWQRRLAEDRWLGLSWPVQYGGRGCSALHVAIFNLEYARSRAPQPVNRVGLNLVGPTLLAHGTEEQRRRYLPPLLTAEEIWCQLFSEPGAGSDLAAVATTARPDGTGWRLTGQKVWTSYAQFARWGMAVVRTDPQAAKRRGLSFLVVDMTAPGVTIRPLRQITGDAEFNEVFLEDVYVPGDSVVGEVNGGWQVAATTLAHERGTTFPFKEQVVQEILFADLLARLVDDGAAGDPVLADALGARYVELRLLALANLRTMTRLGKGDPPGAESSVVKLIWTQLSQRLAEMAGDQYPLDPLATRQYLWSKAGSIAGGTSEIQRDIIADRLLGLPRVRPAQAVQRGQ
jgi:alkylation response protein AidB-like acyl-CoA dehydrogenase